MTDSLRRWRFGAPGRWTAPVAALAMAALAAVATLGLLAAPPARAQGAISEADLKAALVFNFARYVEWPESAFASREAPLVICLVGQDRYVGAFAALEARRLQGRPVRLRSGVAPDDARGCHVAFVSDPGSHQLLAALRALAAQPVLTVSDIDGFIDSGGAIGIVAGEERLQFEVNRDALERAHLRASSNLLKLARAVVGKGG